MHGTSTCYAVPEKSPPSFGRAEHPSRPKRGANRHQQQQQPVSESNTWRGHPLTLGLSPKQLVTGRRAAPCRRHRVCGSCLRVRRSNDYHLIARGERAPLPWPHRVPSVLRSPPGPRWAGRIYDSQAVNGGRVKLETGETVTGREELHAIYQQWRRLWNTSATAGGSVVSELLSAFADNEHKKSSVRVRVDLTPSD